MTINKKKSGIIFLELGKSNRINKKYKKLNIDKYPIINKYKYLGTIIDNNMNLKANTQYVINKMNNNQKTIYTQKYYNKNYQHVT